MKRRSEGAPRADHIFGGGSGGSGPGTGPGGSGSGSGPGGGTGGGIGSGPGAGGGMGPGTGGMESGAGPGGTGSRPRTPPAARWVISSPCPQTGGPCHENANVRILRPEQLNDEQRTVYEAIVGGPRASGPQLFALTAPDGSLHGPFGLMVQVPALGAPLQELGAAIRYRSALSDREREIAVLTLARITDSDFERYAHEAVGRAIGLTTEEVAGLRDGSFAGEDPREAAVARLSARLADTPVVIAEDRQALAAGLDDDTVIAVAVLAGYYRTLAQMMGLFGIAAPG